MQKLVIKEEFKDLIPPLTKEEFDKLENSIKTEGCREPIIVWNNYIIDGHYRYKICKEHNIPFSIWNNDHLRSEKEVKIWIIDKELNKYRTGRKLSSAKRLNLSYKLIEIESMENNNV